MLIKIVNYKIYYYLNRRYNVLYTLLSFYIIPPFRPGRRGPANDLYGLQEGEPIEQPGSGPDPGSGRRRYPDGNGE